MHFRIFIVLYQQFTLSQQGNKSLTSTQKRQFNMQATILKRGFLRFWCNYNRVNLKKLMRIFNRCMEYKITTIFFLILEIWLTNQENLLSKQINSKMNHKKDNSKDFNAVFHLIRTLISKVKFMKNSISLMKFIKSSRKKKALKSKKLHKDSDQNIFF